MHLHLVVLFSNSIFFISSIDKLYVIVKIFSDQELSMVRSHGRNVPHVISAS